MSKLANMAGENPHSKAILSTQSITSNQTIKMVPPAILLGTQYLRLDLVWLIQAENKRHILRGAAISGYFNFTYFSLYMLKIVH